MQKKLLHTLSRSRVKTIHVFFVNTNNEATRQLICKKEKSHFLMKYDKLEIFQSIKIVVSIFIHPVIFKIAQNVKKKKMIEVERISLITRQVYVLNDQFVKD